MTLDTLTRAQLTSAVDDTTVPPGLAGRALAGGRRRRRRRTTAGFALVTAAVVAGTALLPDEGPVARDAQVADGGAVSTTRAALAWARSLPQGPDATVPFFGDGGLWSDGTRHDVPAAVNRTVAPRAVAGGWLVFVGADEADMHLALLTAAGDLRELPGRTTGSGMRDSFAVAVSADGRRVAFRDLVVDLASMSSTVVPHRPASGEADGWATETRMLGFTDDGLLYEGTPFAEGAGTTWLLRDDGTTVQADPPATSHVSDGDEADTALAFDYADDDSDTCVTAYALRGTSWETRSTGCMGQYLGEALATSPGTDWLLTDDLPRVWGLTDGTWHRVDMPDGVGRQQMEAQMGGAVWEDADSFLLPISDRWDNTVPIGESYEHVVQVVRCTVTTGGCERAGAEQDVTVTTSMWGSTELRFAQP